MQKIVVAVGSTRQPKLNAVFAAIHDIGPLLNPDAEFEILGVDVPSGVRHTPTTRAEIMAGARGRAAALQRLSQERENPWHYFVGLEGGLEQVHSGSQSLDNAANAKSSPMVFLESWAFVMDQAGREAYGQSGGILLPEALAAQVMNGGMELSAAIDSFAGARGIRDEQGAWGVLTKNLITRQEAFRIALIHAFAPFYNADVYSRAAIR